MNGDGREFIELKQEFKDYKDRQMEANVDIKGRLTSIDASLSALAPIIAEHKERFNTMDLKCVGFEKKAKENSSRISRLELGFIGALVTLAGVTLTNVWQHIFPPPVSV